MDEAHAREAGAAMWGAWREHRLLDALPHGLRPRDAATLLVLDGSGGDIKVLMGRRHERHKFMPGMFVFPGGRVDPQDSRVKVTADYEAPTKKQIMFDMKKLVESTCR